MTERAATTSTGGSDEVDASSRGRRCVIGSSDGQPTSLTRPSSPRRVRSPTARSHQRALSAAEFFRELGVGRGDVVAAQLPNSLEFLLTDLAAGYLGATLQPIHMPYRSAEIRSLLA